MNNGYAICFNEWALDKEIKNEIRLLLIISSLTAEKGYCYASNEYLANLFEETEETISRKIKTLESKNYITIEYEKRGCEITKRRIRLTKISIVDYQKCQSTIDKNIKDNNTNINNTSNNIYEYYESIHGRTINAIEYETITNWIKDKTEDQIKKAIDETAKSGIDNMKYVEKVLYGKPKPEKTLKTNKPIPEWYNKEITTEESDQEDEEFKSFIEEFRKN